MNVFDQLLSELPDLYEIKKSLRDGEGVSVSGLVDSAKAHFLSTALSDFPVKVIVTYDERRAKELYTDISFFENDVVFFPEKDFIFFQADIKSNELTKERVRAYRRIMAGGSFTIVTTFAAMMAKCMPPEILKENMISISKDSIIEEEALAVKLIKMGFERTTQVENGGQFSIRGGIIDVFDLTEENPYRIELWGDEVDSIRSFDVLSQRSIEELKDINIYPASEMILSGAQRDAGLKEIEAEAKKCADKLREAHEPEKASRLLRQAEELREDIEAFGVLANLDSYLDYFCKETGTLAELFDKDETVFIVDEPAHCKESYEFIEFEFTDSMKGRIEKGYALPGQAKVIESGKKILADIQKKHYMTVSTLDTKTPGIKINKKYLLNTKGIPSFQNSFEMLVKEFNRYKKNGFKVVLVTPSRTRAKRLSGELRDRELSCFYSEDGSEGLLNGQIMSVYGRIDKGFSYPELKFAVISESDIFSAKTVRKKKKTKFEGGERIRSFDDLHVGDYVVHESHGIGVYKGIEKVEREGVVKDYMKIEYRGGGNLYVRATGFDAVKKYASADAKKPKLNKLGSKEWEGTKKKVSEAVGEVAKELVELYAERMNKNGFQYGADTVWQKEFEEMFPYEETADQLTAIEAVKKDMESTKIMDRLICGDVGFGKTEVAIRAAFKAVQEGKQVAYLVPTTILAKQHYDTFKQRMNNYPIRVEMLSRFRTAAEQKKVIESLKKGEVDIVIGTHRLLSKDVGYKDLGLLVIDEEQRFGVAHKEKIKQLKKDVDVMVLTATPIPRTLHMSLIGIRDMSLLEEAPNDRIPIQTYVLEYNEEMVREAVGREMARDGQVYYVYNRVASIAEFTERLRAILPEARIEFAHGQMKENELEHVLYDFINGDIDVLVSTTIIETGIDIPNVNTMIVHDSDNMGLAQLYQLRGRVGRGNRNAYAFLMYKRDKVLKEVAEKRLEAIREFTDLGSGFRISMRDLEIRGAGNLLGKMQHGHLEAVGYDLYCKMLNEAVSRMKGEKVETDFETTVDIDINAFIPAEYILNEIQKLDIYKRISTIETVEDMEEMRAELKDRFGTIPEAADKLLKIALLKARAHKLSIYEVRGKKNLVTMIMRQDAPIRVENIPLMLQKTKNRMSFSPKGVPTFSMRLKPVGFDEKDEAMLLDACIEMIDTIEEYF